MAIDPICGMMVKEDERAIVVKDNGSNHFFCSEHCRKKFLQQKLPEASPAKIKINENIIFTCPMHPEIRQNKSGDCPKCGMHFEPLSPAGDEDESQKEIHFLSRKLWIGLALTIPIVVLSLIDMLPVLNVDAFSIASLFPWLQLILATPVIFGAGGFFFIKAWKSVVNRSLNMFTLIAMGVGAAYFYSVAAVLFPR